MINLIDSPGHVDFYGEVSAAVRLCDGCLIVVDVVEGVCPQTVSALKQAWIEGLKPILILNKMDRLYFEKKLTPLDAYIHLQQILERINIVQGELFTSGVLKADDEEEQVSETKVKSQSSEKEAEAKGQPEVKETLEGFTFDWTSPLDDVDDSEHYFTPETNNVIFASATDSWAFNLDTFASFFAKKYDMSKSVLNRTLWGDYYLDMKKKRILKGAASKVKKPMFVQMILENVWSLFEAVHRKEEEKLDRIISILEISDLETGTETYRFKS